MADSWLCVGLWNKQTLVYFLLKQKSYNSKDSLLIMKLYVCHSCGFDYIKELYEPLRKSELSRKHQIFLPHEGNNGTVNTTQIIKDSDLIIAEVSLKSTGMGIELGRAEVFGKRIICIYKKGADYPKVLRFVSKDFIEYNDSQDMINKIKNLISSI